MSMLDQLQEMGFPLDLATKALVETGEVGLIEAVEWIEAYQKSADVVEAKLDGALSPGTNTSLFAGNQVADNVTEESEADSVAEEQGSRTGSSTEQQQAMSFKCDVCGKNLADDQAVMFHAMRTNHEEFSESAEVLKPLTQEEKKEKLASLQHKLKEIKVRKEEEEKKEALEKEKRRRLEGKSMAKVEQERKDLEIKKLLEQKKREKQEEAEARKRVLEQIRLDREARKAAQEQRQQPQSASRTERVQESCFNVANEVRDDSFCHIQVRLFDGSVIKEKFKSDEPLSHVRLWVEMNDKNLTMKGTPFTLMTPFPRKIFTEEDMEAPIKAHGLVPTANMVVTRFVP